MEANAEDVNIRRSAVLSALEQRSHNAPIQSEQHVGIERHTAPLHEICSKSVAGIYDLVLNVFFLLT